MRFSSIPLFFFFSLTLAAPIANQADNEVVARATAAKPAAQPSSAKEQLINGIQANINAGKAEISSTEKAQKDAKDNNANGLKTDENGIKSALADATADRENNQKIAGNKDPALTQGLAKVQNAQTGAKQTVDALTGNPKTDQAGLDKLDQTFENGKKTNQNNLEEAKKNFPN
ncbi:hypothetical protein LZ32DRAFT_653786 [Colletotrichum eremochloae]|nr:hypothetical protein LZ32DRAFT_653786 [Colletotrichum eremochloae]